jgi:hypothetical protein
MTAEPPVLAPNDPATRERKLAQAIDRALLGNLGLARILADDDLANGREPHPRHTASVAEGLAHYQGAKGSDVAAGWSPMFALWLNWRAVELVVDAYDELRGVKRVTPAPAPALPQPDEAPGLDVPAPTGAPAETQPRLAGIG